MSAWQFRWVVVAGIIVITFCGCSPPRPASPPAARPARSAKEIVPEAIAARQELASLFSGFDAVFDEHARTAAAPKAIPAIRRYLRLGRELMNSPEFAGGPDFSDAEKLFWASLLCVLGDSESLRVLDRLAASDDPWQRSKARAVRLMMDWFRSGRDDAPREQVAAQLSRLVEENPEPSGAFDTATLLIANTTSPDERRLRDKLRKIWSEQMRNDPDDLEHSFGAADMRYEASKATAATRPNS
jgi:hypothetical protein